MVKHFFQFSLFQVHRADGTKSRRCCAIHSLPYWRPPSAPEWRKLAFASPGCLKHSPRRLPWRNLRPRQRVRGLRHSLRLLVMIGTERFPRPRPHRLGHNLSISHMISLAKRIASEIAVMVAGTLGVLEY